MLFHRNPHGKSIPARWWARNIAANYRALFPRLEALCRATCPWCPTPCCGHATVWFDAVDRCFLNLQGLALPPGPFGPETTPPCRYLGPRGCRLPRLQRPWICHWYLCPTQRRRLQAEGPEALEGMDRLILQSKAARRAMMQAAELAKDCLGWTGSASNCDWSK